MITHVRAYIYSYSTIFFWFLIIQLIFFQKKSSVAAFAVNLEGAVIAHYPTSRSPRGLSMEITGSQHHLKCLEAENFRNCCCVFSLWQFSAVDKCTKPLYCHLVLKIKPSPKVTTGHYQLLMYEEQHNSFQNFNIHTHAICLRSLFKSLIWMFTSDALNGYFL